MKRVPKDRPKSLKELGVLSDAPPSKNGRRTQDWLETWAPLLKLFDWSHEKLAEELDVPAQNVWRWATGRGNPSAGAASAIRMLAKQKRVSSPV